MKSVVSSYFEEYGGVFLNNISIYYVICLVISMLAVGATFFYPPIATLNAKRQPKYSRITKETMDDFSATPSSSEIIRDESSDADTSSRDLPSPQTERELIMDTMASHMTSDDLLSEKEVEKRQLKEIMNLLAADKEKFKIDTLEDLEDQMKLYKTH